MIRMIIAIICFLIGLYCAVWVCFFGGIVDLIIIIKSPGDVNELRIAFDILRIIFFELPLIAGSVLAAIIIPRD